MEQDDGFGCGIGSMAEVVNVSIWAEAADDGGAGWSVDGLALRADRDFAVVTDAGAGLPAPDVGPPRTVGISTSSQKIWRLFSIFPVPVASENLIIHRNR